MNKTVFIDTSAWFAGIAKNDQFHTKAIQHQRKLMKEKVKFITSNLVIHETTMLLERKVSKKNAAYKLYQKYLDQDFSIADTVSFVIMKEPGINRCFTFDTHFKTMKFRVEPIH